MVVFEQGSILSDAWWFDFKKMAPRKNYTPDEMTRALQLISNGMPVAAAAKQTGIPRTTLLYKSTGKSPKVCSMGPPTTLTSQEETILVQWIILLQQRHFSINKSMLLDRENNNRNKET